LSDFGLNNGNSYHLTDVLDHDRPIEIAPSGILLNDQQPHSVRLLRIIDESVPAAAPTISVQAPSTAKVREDLSFSAQASPEGVPPLSYRWDFGDGITVEGVQVKHTYTKVGKYDV